MPGGLLGDGPFAEDDGVNQAGIQVTPPQIAKTR
jgi:hypothetical protein